MPASLNPERSAQLLPPILPSVEGMDMGVLGADVPPLPPPPQGLTPATFTAAQRAKYLAALKRAAPGAHGAAVTCRLLSPCCPCCHPAAAAAAATADARSAVAAAMCSQPGMLLPPCHACNPAAPCPLARHNLPRDGL